MFLLSDPPKPDNAPTSLLSPALHAALAELAAIEELPVGALVAILINEALTTRLQHRRRAC